MRKGLYIVCLLLLIASSYSNAQVGREFWFVAPELTSSHGDSPIMFRITTFDVGTDVTIEFPANPGVSPINTYIPPNTQYSTPENIFDLNDIENRPSNTVLKKGVLITAHDADITAYYEIAHSGNPDKFTLKGRNANGTEFFVPSQNHYRNNHRNPAATEKIDIVATTNGTEVVIVPTADVTGHSKGDTIRVILNRGETFGLVNENESKGSSLAGTYITASEPIAVTISDDSIHNNDGGSAHDLIGDQLIPTNVIGTEYVIVNTSTDDYTTFGATLKEVYITATEDNTAIYRNGSATPFKTLHRGESTQVTITNNNMFLRSTKPIYVYQLASMRFDGDGNEIGSSLLPHASCTGSDVVTVKRIFKNEFFLQLMVKGKNRNDFVVTDSEGGTHNFLDAVNWKKARGTDDDGNDEAWYTANIRLSSEIDTRLVYFVRNTGGLFHLSILEENRSSVSYGYFSSFSNLNVNGLTEGCKGDHILLNTLEPMKSYEWHSSQDPDVVLSTDRNCQADHSGTFWVTAEVVFGGCTLTDSLEVVFKQPEVDLGPDTLVCPGTVLTFGDNTSSNSYEWSNGDNTNETNINVTDGYNQELRVVVTDAEGCSNKDTIAIGAFNVPDIDLSVTSICEGARVSNSTSFDRYEWSFNGTIINSDPSQNFIEPTVSGLYSLTAYTANDCSVTEDFNVVVYPLPEVGMVDTTICDGLVGTIDAPVEVGHTYLWSDGSTNGSLNISTPGDYWLQVTDANGCVNKEDFSFAYHLPIPIDLGPDRNECTQTSLNIANSTDFHDFVWRYDDGVNPIADLRPQVPENEYHIANAEVDDSGIYIVEAKDINGCDVSDEVKIGFYDVEAPKLTTDQNLCVGESIEIVASDGYSTYEWSRNGTHVPAYDGQTSITVSSAGAYLVKAVRADLGCTKESEIVVSQYAKPTIQLPADYSICPDTETSITIDGYTKNVPENELDYLYWGTDDTKRFSDWTTASLDVDAVGTYSVTAVDTLGCITTDDVAIGFHTLANLDLGAPQTECENIGVVLQNPIGANTYTWSKIGNPNNLLLSTDADYTATETGSYILDLEDLNGCLQGDTLVVIANPVPTLDLGPDVDFCEYESFEVTASKGYDQYRWNDDPTLNEPSISITTSGNYKLEVANAYGCWTEDNIVVTVNPTPVFDIPDPAPECPGVLFTLSGPAGMVSYNWSTYETDQTVEKYDGKYWLKVISNNGCEYTDTVRVSNHPVPKVSLGIDTTICPLHGPFDLDAGIGYSSYQWHNGALSQTIRAEMHDTINIVTVTNAEGCSNSDDRLVIHMEPPVLELLNDTAICSVDSLELDGYSDEFIEWEWSTGETTPSIIIDQPGEYRLRASDGCVWSQDTMQLVLNPTPVIAQLDTSVYSQVVIYPAGGTEPYQYSIDDGNLQDKNVFSNLAEGEHYLCVEDVNGCMARDTVYILEDLNVVIPNFFTPNGDGINDIWIVDGLNRLPDSEIRIYDRYGKLLIKYKASEPGWDGKYLGTPVRSDDYWYVIELIPIGKHLKGNLTIQR